MRIVWKKEGELQEAILMVPTSCAKSPTARGQVLSTIVPSSVVDACPTAVGTLNALVASEAFGGLVADPKGSTVPVELPRHWKRLAVPIAAGLVVLAMASSAFFVLRRRRALRASGGEPAAKPESDAPKPETDAPKPPGDA
jgi:hypothetical protein